jgi:hypothetical protein
MVKQGGLAKRSPGLEVMIKLTTCARCGRSFEVDAWSDLELVQRIGAERVWALVTRWPSEKAIEVRRCGCGFDMGRMVTEGRIE